jgi:pimeloyl-ACP methyl ester carboxylesterase
VHLTGHSFGARLVSYALTGLPDTAVGAASPVKSLTLVQGAFSHFAFADPTPCKAVKAGALAGMLDRVDGPLVATFSSADRAVGWWYPTASMLAHQNAESVNDLTYQWGGMGHDGFQQSPAADTLELKAAEEQYQFQPGSLYLLDANKIICADQSPVSGAHSDIVHPEVAWAMLSAAAV